jgi:hypothetical protein
MHFQFEVSPSGVADSAAPVGRNRTHIADALRELLEVQREQLSLLRQSAASHDAGSRWKAVLARWQDDFAHLPGACKQVLPQLEKAYISLISELTAYLREQGRDSLDNEFALSEFLDRYGFRLNQMGTILNLVGPLAEIATTVEESK